MIQNAQANGKTEQENYFTALLKCLNPEIDNEKGEKNNVRVSVNSFFEDKPLSLNPKVKAGKIEDYVSPLFYAPNVSWLVQRNLSLIHIYLFRPIGFGDRAEHLLR